MPHGPTKIDSKGICIYCRKAGIRLTDEHIVPLSIGGQHVIKEASCHNCAKVTSKFERDVIRGLWGDARTRKVVKSLLGTIRKFFNGRVLGGSRLFEHSLYIPMAFNDGYNFQLIRVVHEENDVIAVGETPQIFP